MLNGNRIVCIAPCYNELHKIDQVVRRVKEVPCVDEMVVIDDGSTDGSPDSARELGATVLSLGRMQGVGAAIRAGIDYALDKKFDVIVVIAGNNKDEPKEIERLVAPIIYKGYDFVQGSRFLKGGSFSRMPLYRIFATRVHPLLFSLVVGKWVTESTNGFRAFRASIFKDKRINLWQKWLDAYELEPYLYYKVIKLGYKTTEVPVTKTYPPRQLGYTKMKPITGWWSILRPLLLLAIGLRK